MLEIVTYGISLIVLAVASFTDIKTREVPDWLNYAAAASGIAISLLYSLITGSAWPIIYSVAGFLVFLALATLMFYAGQWGGGDSKMLIALGAILGLQFGMKFPYISLSQAIVSFWMNLLLAGIFYALFCSVLLAIKNRHRFAKQFSQQTAQIRTATIAIAATAVLIFLIPDTTIKIALASVAAVTIAALAIWAFGKAVEKSCMLKYVGPEKLTEGDWIAKDVYVNRKYVCGPKDLGIEKSQIRQLIRLANKGKIKKILIKEGIPFVPAFLIAFLITIKFGNVLIFAFNHLL